MPYKMSTRNGNEPPKRKRCTCCGTPIPRKGLDSGCTITFKSFEYGATLPVWVIRSVCRVCFVAAMGRYEPQENE